MSADLAWIILFAPLVAALIITVGTLRFRRLSAGIAIVGLSVSFILSVAFMVAILKGMPVPVEVSVCWLNVGGLMVEFGVLIDRLAVLMLFVVTSVSILVFIYSLGYMHEDEGFSRYYATLALFCFSMIGIVLSNNLLQSFIFWELVGMSSYLLIGFWFEKSSAAEAGKKAFLVNRVGDFGFLAGILCIWALSGRVLPERTLNFGLLEGAMATLAGNPLFAGILALTGILLLCGVLGKSAQFPFHVWLPDAMEGPTPVSALIHAATMVAAGVFLLCRAFFIFSASPITLEVIAWIGGFTAIFAATIAVVQDDIKRVLAFSTLSQLGYMVMALGLDHHGAHGYTAGMFHLSTHAFFKALLFLGAGSVIHAVGTQNIWQMGGLFSKMKTTAVTFLVASAALCGIFPLSGFFSKDEILAVAFHNNKPLYVIGSIAAFLTAFYMTRLCLVVFFGKPRDTHAFEHAHESPRVMTVPLVILAVLSVIAGWGHQLTDFISPGLEIVFDMQVALISSAIALAGIGCGVVVYKWGLVDPAKAKASMINLFNLLYRKYYIDECYLWFVKNVQQGFADFCALFERRIIMGAAVDGTAGVVRLTGYLLRFFQSGRLQNHALWLLLGLSTGLAIVYFLIEI